MQIRAPSCFSRVQDAFEFLNIQYMDPDLPTCCVFVFTLILAKKYSFKATETFYGNIAYLRIIILISEHKINSLYIYGLRASFQAYLPQTNKLDNDGDVPEGYLHGPVELLVDGHVHHLVLALQDAFLLSKKNITEPYSQVHRNMNNFLLKYAAFERSGSIYVHTKNSNQSWTDGARIRIKFS